MERLVRELEYDMLANVDFQVMVFTCYRYPKKYNKKNHLRRCIDVPLPRPDRRVIIKRSETSPEHIGSQYAQPLLRTTGASMNLEDTWRAVRN
jgi:hypothetical protein